MVVMIVVIKVKKKSHRFKMRFKLVRTEFSEAFRQQDIFAEQLYASSRSVRTVRNNETCVLILSAGSAGEQSVSYAATSTA